MQAPAPARRKPEREARRQALHRRELARREHVEGFAPQKRLGAVARFVACRRRRLRQLEPDARAVPSPSCAPMLARIGRRRHRHVRGGRPAPVLVEKAVERRPGVARHLERDPQPAPHLGAVEQVDEGERGSGVELVGQNHADAVRAHRAGEARELRRDAHAVYSPARGDELGDRRLAGDPDVVLVLEQAPERDPHELRLEPVAAEPCERLRPVDRLGDARELAQIALAQRLHEARDRAREVLVEAGHLRVQDGELLLEAGMLDVEIEAAPAERVADLARPVRGEDDVRHVRRLDRPELGDGDLEVRQHLEQERLEAVVGAVDLVDRAAPAARRGA